MNTRGGYPRWPASPRLRLGLPQAIVAGVHLAGLLRALDRVSVSDATWETRKLTSLEWEKVRLHVYHSERILARLEPAAVEAV